MALGFGLIHGLGFSNFFRSLLGKEESIVQPLLAFNIGVELGQLIIVAIILAIGYIVMNFLNAKQREWNLVISGAAAGDCVYFNDRNCVLVIIFLFFYKNNT